jgi:TolA-binding protein
MLAGQSRAGDGVRFFEHQHKGGFAVKISAKFLLSGVFVLLPATSFVPLYAQHYRGALPSSYQELRDYDGIGVKSDEQKAIENLEERCQHLEDALKAMQFNASIYDAHLMVNQIDDNRKKLLTVETKLYETEDRLTKAEETIAALDLRLLTLEASKPKAPVNKPTLGKPTAPANKPAVKEGTH